MDNETIRKEFVSIEEKIIEYMSYDETKKDKILKKEELELKEGTFIHSKEYYREKVFNKWNDDFIDKLDIEIEFCETVEQRDIWNYFKTSMMTLYTKDSYLKPFKILVKDKITLKYLGIINLTPDIFSYNDRDKFIGWSNENKIERIQITDSTTQPRISFLVNIQCCVGLQPVAYNTNLGKLLVAIVFSKEVIQKYKEVYGYYYAGVCTLSLYGKSIQYDRLKEIRFIGMTKGYGVSQIPISLIQNIIEFIKKHHYEEYNRFKDKYINKMRLLHFFISKYKCYDFLKHEHKRGIYFGYTGTNNHLFFQGKQDSYNIDFIKPISTIVTWWKERWAKPRWKHLQRENRVKIYFEFKDLTYEEKKIEYNRQYQFHRYHGDLEFREQLLEKKREKYKEDKSKLPEDHHKQVASIQRRTISFDQIMEIIQWKDKMNRDEKFMDKKKISKRKVAEYLSKKFETSITEGMIKKYWNGECILDKSEFYNESIYTFDEYMKIIKY